MKEVSQESWLWFIDDQLVEAMLGADTASEAERKREAASPELVRAVNLQIEGRSEEALEKLNSATGENALDAALIAGRIHFDRDDFEKAAEAYGRACDLAPRHPYAHYNLGVCLARLGQWNEAAAAFERAVAASPDRTGAWLGWGVCLLHADRAADAVHAFAECRSLDPENVPAAFGYAVACHLEGRLDEAAELYDALLEYQPDAEEVLNNATGLAILRKDWDAAENLAARLGKVNPEARSAVLAQAIAAYHKGDAQRAANLCARLAQSNPDSFSDWFNLGVCYQRLGNHAQAAMAYRNALRSRPASAEAKEGLAAALKASGGRDELIALLRASAGEKPDASSYFRLGCLLFEKAEYAESALAFENCLNLEPEHPGASFNLGLAYRKLGNFKAASAALEQALSREPGNEDVLRALAATAIESGDAAQAERWLSQLSVGAWDVAYNLGLLHENAGSHEAAAACFRRAVEENPDCVEALVNLGHALMGMGAEQEARESWQRAIEQRPELATAYFS